MWFEGLWGVMLSPVGFERLGGTGCAALMCGSELHFYMKGHAATEVLAWKHAGVVILVSVSQNFG